MRPLKPLFAALICSLSVSSCDEGERLRCAPETLTIGNYSLKFIYDGGRKPVRIEYYLIIPPGKPPEQKIELTYNADHNLESVTMLRLVDMAYRQEDKYTLYYGNNGLPETMENQFNKQTESKVVTEFTHSVNGTLMSATIRSVRPEGEEYNLVIGGYRYEYNSDGNVTRVYYTPNEIVSDQEVLARENLTFDNSAPFYEGIKGLATMNIYCFRYIPNVNNTLTAKVKYLDIDTHFQQPQDVTFDIKYDQQGRVTSVSSMDAYYISYHGELLFSEISYACR